MTDKHQGEQLGYYPLQEGDVVVVDRGYNQAKGLIAQADRGVSVVLRYNPHRLNVYDAAGDPTTEAAAIIQRLGVNISDLSDLPALFQQFHTAGLTAADAIKIFGLEGAGAAQILARLAPDLQTLTGPVSSGYRCAAHNQRVSNTKASAHTFGIAIDLRLSGERVYRVVTAAAAYGFTGIGVQQKGPHEKRFIHLDTLSPKEGPRPAVWSYP